MYWLMVIEWNYLWCYGHDVLYNLGWSVARLSQVGAIVPLEVYPYNYHMQGISLHSGYSHKVTNDICKVSCVRQLL